MTDPQWRDAALDGTAIDALIRAYAACTVALGALPGLPADIREAAEGPLRGFCQAIEPALADADLGKIG